MIEVSHLTKKYGSNIAVDDLSFTVNDGQIYGFLGPNGAGKTTTMNIITGYLGTTDGEVIINGHDIVKEPEEAKKCIGYLPEIPPLYDSMTVMEYLQFVAELKKITRTEREKQIGEVMELTRIADMKNRLIQNLSKGYRQRVGIAQAVLGYPPIIILDEPTVGLDPKQIIEIRQLIRELSTKHTVILSSHILTEISAVCDHIMILSHGKLVACDTTEKLGNLLEGSTHLTVQVKAKEEKLRTILDNMKGISDYQILKNEKEFLEVQIQMETGKDIREDLFYALAADKMPIMQMGISATSLEDVFLELTADNNVQADETESNDTEDDQKEEDTK